MRYRTLETQSQTILYWDSFALTCSFRGEKYLNTFIVTSANDCPNLLSHGATFRMGILLPNHTEEKVVKEENVPNFNTSTGTSTGTSSNVFQILQDLRLKQYQESHPKTSHTSTHSTTGTLIQNMAQPTTSFRTTTPSTAMTGRTTTNRSIEYKYFKILHVRHI